ncbi:hypothetical protein E1B28_009564 [Marasmius oreades]|uniref:Cryptic loci regulator 2 N-terminal domain-containing protein n=1 Tax=Marasmius oreades TaxID=181124 RepID=A0A9P7RVH7_9AGAR|nr:uncharacterized protein E1B28_009564 [Marasmius oreades]KAG7090447.1 hypothetical protein E1B28_009564 [Marasmius oreades]
MTDTISKNGSISRITFPRSDGSPNRQPNPSRAIKLRECKANENSELVDPHMWKWYKAIGEALARALKWPNVEPNACILSSFPKYYTLYKQARGCSEDCFLFGSINCRPFRSPNEFIEHAIWLFTDPTMTKTNCRCRGCTHNPQRNITNDLKRRGIFWTDSLLRVKKQTSGPTACAPQRTQSLVEIESSDSSPSTSQENQPRNDLKVMLQPQLEPYGAAQRTVALEVAPLSRNCQFRIGDLIDVILEHPIESPDLKVSICAWPAIVLNVIPALLVYSKSFEMSSTAFTGSDDCDIVVQILGFDEFALAVSQENVLPYHPVFHTNHPPCTLSFELAKEVNHVAAHATSFSIKFEVATALHTRAVQLAVKVASKWSILNQSQAETFDNGSKTLIRASSIWLGGEEIQVGDVVKVAFPSGVVDELTKSVTQSSSTTPGPSRPGPDGLFARIYGFDVILHSPADSEETRISSGEQGLEDAAELRVSAAFYKLEPMGDASRDHRCMDGDLKNINLPPAPAGFTFYPLHDPDLEVVFRGDQCITGRYHPALLERILPGRCLSEELWKVWEVAGLKMGAGVRRKFYGDSQGKLGGGGRGWF